MATGLALSAALGATTGHAQTDDPAAQSAKVQDEVSPPRPLAPLRADYPVEGEGDHVVTLFITVNKDGSVRSARVLAGDPPFAAAAMAASVHFRFLPAMDKGQPIAAAIRAEIAFTASPGSADTPAPLPAAPTTPVEPKVAIPPRALEVDVRGDTRAPGVTSFTRAEVRLLPGAFGDPFRAIETLPGVTPLASGVPFFYVRGAPPGNVGYSLDGIRLPLLYHIGLGPSVVHPATVDRVDLYPGGYPARFGRYAGGMVAGETRDLDSVWRGEASVRLVDAGAMVEGPIGAKGAVLAAARYSYTGALLSLFSPDVSLSYWDYQVRARVDLSPRDQISVFALGAHDFLGTKDNGQETTLFDTTFHRLDLRYEHRFGTAENRFRQSITLGFDRTAFDKGAYAEDRLLNARSDFTWRVSDGVLFRSGADVAIDGYNNDLRSAFPGVSALTSLFSSRIEVVTGMHADAVIAITPRFEVIPGLRVDVYEANGTVEVAVDPRVSARLAITKDVRLIQAHGLASQAPSFVVPGPGFQPDLVGGLQRSLQSSVGVEADLPADITASTKFFRNAFFNMTDALGIAPAPTSRDSLPSSFNQRTLGSSLGLEVMIRRRLTRHLGGFVSYTLSRSVRAFGTSTIASAFDRTHVLNGAFVYNFNGGYKAGARGVFYSGFPILVDNPTAPFGVREVGRLAPFFRLDVRLEKRWALRRTGWVSLVLEVLNTTLNKETLGQTCTLFACSPTTLGPITIPSLGVEGGF